MENKIIFLIFCFVWEVNSMALKGPALTRYDPCGLGFIHFDKISANNWRGEVQFGLYSNLFEAEIVIGFERENTISAHKNTSNVTARRTNKHDLIIHALQPVPRKYEFFVALDNLNVNESDVPVVTVITMNNVTLCSEEIKASQTISALNLTQKFAAMRYVQVCGRRSLDNEELLSVRTDAKAGDWPWHVAIFLKDNNNVLRYQCGGNVVSKTAILTAGHCVYKDGGIIAANKVVVVAGTVNHKDFRHVGRQVLNAWKIILHPAYNPDYATSDLAMIKVSNLEFTEYVQPICVWGPVYKKSDLFGKEAVVVGFGATENNKQSEVLRSMNTMIQNDTVCITFSANIYAKLLNEFTYCAGYGPTSSINPRNGDSGGGLVIPTMQADHKVSWFLRGVLSKCGVSPGQTQCDPKYYIVYTDVAPHYGWIYHHADLEFRSNILMY